MADPNQRFLGPGDFTGTFRKPSSVPQIGAESTFRGALTFFNMPRSDVARIVPAGIELAAKRASKPDVHPVLLILGRHENLRWLLPVPDARQLPLSYSELVLLVPFVERRGATNWHSLAVRMHLDNRAAVKLGNEYYGYAKELATLSSVYEDGAPTRFETNKPTRYFDADLRHEGAWRNDEQAKTTLPNYPDMQAILSMPILGIKAERYVCSYFQWDSSAAYVRPMVTRHEFVERFVDGMDSWTKRPIDGATDGAIALRGLVWRLGWPFDCEFQRAAQP
jgi:hypothetical protein